MKVEVKENGTVKEKPFPKLMKAKNYNRIIIATGFSDDGTIKGFLIKSDEITDILHFSKGWNPSCFSDFEGSITLSND